MISIRYLMNHRRQPIFPAECEKDGLQGNVLFAIFSAIPPFWAIVIATIMPGLCPAGTAFINSFASLGSFAGPLIFGIFVQQSHQYDEVSGLAVLGGVLVLCCCLLLFSGKELKARSTGMPP